MASRSVSPGGALLRASRVFSIPPPLPRPQSDLSSTAVFSSDTATLPHPTHLSITTPQSSLARGDWGFKRPLPLRSTTKTSTPFIRVESIDTWEHITEFGSSSDHTLTLQKWQEMGVPLSTPSVQKSSFVFSTDPVPSGKSVFEDAIDTIAPTDGSVAKTDDIRWKFSGPWLAGLSDGEFNTYVSKEVRRRKDDFRKFLRTACANTTTQNQTRTASEQGDEIPPAVQASDVTDEQLIEYIKNLRHDRTELFKLIRIFLDLPPSPNARPLENSSILYDVGEFLSQTAAERDALQSSSTSDSPYADFGPPKTHPSAGLSYGRTSSLLFNHPMYGPQRNKPPVQARVVMPKGAATGNFAPLLGVGGIVVDVPAGDGNSFNIRNVGQRKGAFRPSIPGLFNVEPDKVGGSKSWVHPKHAYIDAKGRIKLNVVTADPEAIAVHEGTVDEIPDEYKRPTPTNFGIPNPTSKAAGGDYGLTSPRLDGAVRKEGRVENSRVVVDELAAFLNQGNEK